MVFVAFVDGHENLRFASVANVFTAQVIIKA